MSFDTKYSEANPDRRSITLAVELDTPKKLAVRAGSFKVHGEDYVFGEDQVWTIPTLVKGKGMFVTGYLVRDEAGTPFVLVDEKDLGPAGLDYQFEGSPYKLMHELFHVKLTKGVKSLAGLDIVVWHTRQPPERT